MEAVVFPAKTGFVSVEQNGRSLACRHKPVKGGFVLNCDGEGAVVVSFKGTCCGKRKSIGAIIKNNLICKP